MYEEVRLSPHILHITLGMQAIVFRWFRSGQGLEELLSLQDIFEADEPDLMSSHAISGLQPVGGHRAAAQGVQGPTGGGSFAARHAALLAAAMLPGAEKAGDLSGLQWLAEAAGTADLVAFTRAHLGVIFAHSWPYVAVEDGQVCGGFHCFAICLPFPFLLLLRL